MKHDTPLLQGLNPLDLQINVHLWDVNSRNGWNLDESEPPSWCDRWVPWIMAGLTVAVVVVVKWINL
uniref:Uncharacterized protein n=1 Tax=viral metagenome TaxID=1070528 RepID=A0A6M3IYI1_9ZZZZ